MAAGDLNEFDASADVDVDAVTRVEVVSSVPVVPDRPSDAHKGTFGTVIVVGGCDTMMGAPALTAAAALRGGVGLCKIATRAEALPTVLSIEPSATGIMLGDDIETNLHLLNQADPNHGAVLAIGPGLGRSEATAELVSELLKGERAIVLDADGLNLLAATGAPARSNATSHPLILTPHPGEFARLAGPFGIDADPTVSSQRGEAATLLARAHQAVVVLKGQRTVVADGTKVYVNTTGNPAMATAGSGDVLTGLIASLIAQHMPPFEAATLGVYLHGLAADLWAADHGPSGMKAAELADGLPRAFGQHRQQRGK